MPVQINEVVVRAVVAPPRATEQSGQIECPPSANSGGDAELLEKVLEVIKEKHER